MKTDHRILLALLTLSAAPLALHAAQDEYQKALAEQVSETASSSSMSRKSKASLIADAVKVSVRSSISDLREWQPIVDTAAGLGLAAAKVAPEYTEEIIGAISGVPRIAATKGLGEAIAEKIREKIAAFGELETANASPTSRGDSGVREFGGSHSESVVSPATVKPKPPKVEGK